MTKPTSPQQSPAPQGFVRARRIGDRFSIWGTVVLTLAGLSYFLVMLSEVQPIHSWLFWRYLGIEAWIVLWATSCAAAGHRIVLTLRRHDLPLLEHVLLSFSVGVLVFYTLTAVVGFTGMLRLGYFLWGPLLLLAVGFRRSMSSVRRFVRHCAFRRKRARRANLGAYWAGVAGIFALLAVWWCTLSPAGTNADSLWYHLALSEQYAHTGSISAYREGWIFAAYPHLASVIYTWAFLLPGYQLSEHIVLATQMEFVCAGVAWASVGAVVRLVIGRARMSGAWTFVWLFPASFFFLPNAGADLVAAMWAGPIFLCTARLWRNPELKSGLLLGLVVAGALNTKYSAVVLLLGPGLGLAIRALFLILGRRKSRVGADFRQILLVGAVTVGTVVVATSPHWLKNTIFYGDPVYPLGRHFLPAHPWTEVAETLQRNFWNMGELWRPPATWSGLAESGVALVDFSFVPRHFGHPQVKSIYFGSLFTLSLPLLLTLRCRARLWGLYGVVLIGTFGWYWLHHQDRYLITLVPWMAAATASTAHLVWRLHWAARVVLSLLVSAQVLWGADVYLAYAKWNDTAALFASARRSGQETKLPVFQPDHETISAQLPQDAVVLLHDYHSLLGLSRKTVSDAIAWQGGIDYREAPTDFGVYQTLRRVGVTHLMWSTKVSQDWDSQASNFAFWGFVERHAKKPHSVGRFSVAEMPKAPPAKNLKEPHILVALCPGNYPTGVHRLSALSIPGLDRNPPPFPKAIRVVETAQPKSVSSALAQVDYVLLNRQCHPKVARLLAGKFSVAAKRGTDQQWVRTTSD